MIGREEVEQFSIDTSMPRYDDGKTDLFQVQDARGVWVYEFSRVIQAELGQDEMMAFVRRWHLDQTGRHAGSIKQVS